MLLRSGSPTPRPRQKRKLTRDLKTLAVFVQIYCDGHHRSVPRGPLHLRAPVALPPVDLCRDCQKLLAHAVVMRVRCPLDPKPACKKCPTHCCAPTYRRQVRAVMRYSGRRLVLGGRLDYLYHLLF